MRFRILGREFSVSRPKAVLDGYAHPEHVSAELRALFGDHGPFGLSLRGFPITRDIAATYSVILRVVSLLAGSGAQLMRTARVEDYDGNVVTDRHAQAVLSLLRESPDGGLTDASQFWEDFWCDYLLDGNALAFVRRTRRGGPPTMLDLMRPQSATRELTEDGGAVFYATQYERPHGDRLYATHDDAVLARWGSVDGRWGGRNRQGFATSPVTLMAGSVDTGLNANEFVRQWFDPRYGGLKSKLAIILDEYIEDDDQRKQFEKTISQYQRQRGPLFLYQGAKIQNIGDTASDTNTHQLRRQQTAEVCAVWGVPALLVGDVELSTWGAGIEQLARFVWRFGLKQHMTRVLAPLSLRLLPRGRVIKIDETDMTRGDTKTAIELARALSGNGQFPRLATRREVRHMLGLAGEPPEDDGLFSTARPPPGPPEPAPDNGGGGDGDGDSGGSGGADAM